MTGQDRGAPARVLLVEDDRVAALFTVEVLRRHGGCTVGPDPAAAVRAVTPGAWDLMITDIEVPCTRRSQTARAPWPRTLPRHGRRDCGGCA